MIFENGTLTEYEEIKKNKIYDLVIMDEKEKNTINLDNVYEVEEEILEENFSTHVNDNKQAMYRKVQITDLQGNPTHMDNVEIKIECIDIPNDNDNDVIVEEAIPDNNEITKDKTQVFHMGQSTFDSLPVKAHNYEQDDVKFIEHKNKHGRSRGKRYRDIRAQLRRIKNASLIHSPQFPGKEELNKPEKDLTKAPEKYDSVEIEEKEHNREQKFEILKYQSMVSTSVDDEKGVLAIHDVDDGPVFVTWENQNDAKDECGVLIDNSDLGNSKQDSLLTNIQNGLNEEINFRPMNDIPTWEPTNYNSLVKGLITNSQEASDKDIYLEMPNIMRLSDHLSEYICRFCRLPCKSKQALIAHLIEHTGKKQVACSICQFLCLTPNALEMHYTNTHARYKRSRY